MSQQEQKDLVSILYSVHNNLQTRKRQTKNDEEWQNVWEEHTADIGTLQEYSKAMHELATKIWDPRNNTFGDSGIVEIEMNSKDEKCADGQLGKKSESRKLKCRLEWVVSRCSDYFKMELGSLETSLVVHGNKLKLLDVGSCYNPFSKYSSCFDIVAIDLCPAPGFEDEIFQGDFLEVKVGGGVVEGAAGSSTVLKAERYKNTNYKKLVCLPQDWFDVVVFSYFLEYLADPRQRLECCRKAFKLLRPGGLLFILRPDSNRVTPGKNNRLVKRLKVGMSLLGLKRIYLEKLEHLWCMGFKKLSEAEKNTLMTFSGFKKDISKVDADFVLEDESRLDELFAISQDSRDQMPSKADELKVVNDNKGDCCGLVFLNELPGFNFEELDLYE